MARLLLKWQPQGFRSLVCLIEMILKQFSNILANILSVHQPKLSSSIDYPVQNVTRVLESLTSKLTLLTSIERQILDKSFRQGETWYKLRSRLTSHITSPRILQNFLPILNVIFDDFIDLLKIKRDPSTFCVENFHDVANLMSLEAVCTLMLGRRMGFLDQNLKEEDKFMKLAAAVKQLFISQRDSYYGLGLWKYFPTKTFRDFAKSEEIIYE